MENDTETENDRQRIEGFLGLLRRGIEAEGQSEAELEEVNEQLARTSGMTPSGDTNIWRV